MIHLKSVERVYPLKGGPFYALRNVTFDIQQGEFISIMGPSGSGKSTLLNILGLHDSAWAGEFKFGEVDVHKLSQKQRLELQKKNIGFVFQSYHLLDDLTVYENLEIPLSYRDIPKAERQTIVCDTLDRFHIVGKKDLYPAQLSGGQQQLVAVARALVAKPRLILADEPTGNLHSDQGREIMELFSKLNKEDGVTIVQVTHSEANAAYGHRVLRLADGLLLK
ncbi:MAG TPA: ABC transporter ATP-binding protein [Opitutaceae bacterium]|nr:ABC transporter ATP-binding protein [Opitutaceae bacterium]